MFYVQPDLTVSDNVLARDVDSLLVPGAEVFRETALDICSATQGNIVVTANEVSSQLNCSCIAGNWLQMMLRLANNH
jgi:hypothetical protein